MLADGEMVSCEPALVLPTSVVTRPEEKFTARMALLPVSLTHSITVVVLAAAK